MNVKDPSKITIAVVGSHSALDVCRGAKDEGFKTLVICQKGREKTYQDYFKTQGEIGCVDDILVLDRFSDILTTGVQQQLLDRNAIFIPHRSFQVYLDFNYDGIEKDFKVPIFGNKFLLRAEERSSRPNQYDLLEKTGIRMPKQFADPKDIDRPAIVKVLERERAFERAFFLVDSFEDYLSQVDERMRSGIFGQEELKGAVIEEFIAGAQVNFNFFYSPLSARLELMGTDTRRQTNLDGLLRIPADHQIEVLKKINVKYEEAGHIAVTVLESMLEDIYQIGERFVEAAKEMTKPGVIGPFGLQSAIIAGPPKKEIIVFDVAPRMPGSPGIFATPYSGYLYGESMSAGRRIAKEIKEAVKQDKLDSILT